MIKFEDLKFENVDAQTGAPMNDLTRFRPHMQALVFFKNGYGVSIISGWPAKRAPGRPYEIAVLKGTLQNYEIYQEPIGYLTDREVETHINNIQRATR